MEANKVGNDMVFFASEAVARKLAPLLSGEYRGASAGMGGIKHWAEAPKEQVRYVMAWLNRHGRREDSLLAQAERDAWGAKDSAYFRELRRSLNRKGKRG